MVRSAARTNMFCLHAWVIESIVVAVEVLSDIVLSSQVTSSSLPVPGYVY
jgi:hypothetical protein